MPHQDLDPDLYAHLRRLASRLSEAQAPTLNPTSLVHEAWEKLARGGAAWNDRNHFVALAARAMRQILVDRARGRRSLKHGGDHPDRTTLSGLAGGEVPTVDLLALDAALVALGQLDERAADVVVLRTFGGLHVPEIAAELQCSERTVHNKWTFGRAFVLSELG